MPVLWGKKYSREDLAKRTGDLSQIAWVTPVELTEGNERGSRAAILRNAAGLELVVLPERGMSILDVSYRGIPLAHKSAVGPVHPSYASFHGLDWLSSWPVGFLTPCGLHNVGSPCVDNGEEHGLHGRISSIPAKQVTTTAQWTDDGDCEISVSGVMRETRVFGDNLALTRRIFARIGDPVFWVEDTVENAGLAPVEYMFLQHINLGWPLLDEHTRLMLPPCSTLARDGEAEKGIEQWNSFLPPQIEYNEQVFYHDCRPDADGFVQAAVVNPEFENRTGLGVYLQYSRDEYPVLVEWKMMRQGLYVLGIEPANCHVEGRVRERARGSLQMINPGEKKSFTLEIGVLCGAKELERLEKDFDWN